MTLRQSAAEGVVVFGYDQRRRPRAGLFNGAQAGEATKKAKAAKMGCAPMMLPEVAALRRDLKAGDIKARGKAIVPLVERRLYEKLLVASGVVRRPSTPKPKTQVALERAAAKAKQPRAVAKDWDEIDVDQLVLSRDEDPECGWYEAFVVEAIDADTFRLIYRDYDEEVTRTRRQLALLPPD